LSEREDHPGEEIEWVSKSAMKREMDSLQAMGERLTQLNAEQLAQVPISDKLLSAIEEYHRLKKNEAMRRQRQYIGRIMRTEDADSIAEVMERFDASKAAHVQHFHELEQWRARLIDDPSAMTELLEKYPKADVQHLRQLVRNAAGESRRGVDKGSSKKLFRALRELAEMPDDQV